MIVGAKLRGVSVKLPPADSAASNSGVSLTPVQDLWERSFKEIGEENPEQVVTGMLLFYPYQLVGYLEVFIISIFQRPCHNKIKSQLFRAMKKVSENACKF